MIQFPVNVLEKNLDTNQTNLEAIALDLSPRWRLSPVNDMCDKHCNTEKTCNFHKIFNFSLTNYSSPLCMINMTDNEGPYNYILPHPQPEINECRSGQWSMAQIGQFSTAHSGSR